MQRSVVGQKDTSESEEKGAQHVGPPPGPQRKDRKPG